MSLSVGCGIIIDMSSDPDLIDRDPENPFRRAPIPNFDAGPMGDAEFAVLMDEVSDGVYARSA